MAGLAAAGGGARDWSFGIFLSARSDGVAARRNVAGGGRRRRDDGREGERLGARAWPGFGGVILVEAKKELTAPIGKVARSRLLKDLIPVRGTSVLSSAPDREPVKLLQSTF